MNNSDNTHRIVVPTCNTIEFLPVTNITRVEAMHNYTRIYLEDGSELVSTNSLGYYRLKLEEFGFYLCHKSYLIKLDKILRYHKDGYIEMEDSAMIPIARRRRDEFINQVLDFVEISGTSSI